MNKLQQQEQEQQQEQQQQATSELTKALLVDLLTKECPFPKSTKKQQAIGIVYPEYVRKKMPEGKINNIKTIVQSPLSFMDFGLDELNMTEEHTDLFLSAMFRNDEKYIEQNNQQINPDAITIFQKCLGFAYQYHNKKSGKQDQVPELENYEDIRKLYTQPHLHNVPGYILGTTRSFVHLVIRKLEEQSLTIDQLEKHENGYESLLKAKEQRKKFVNNDLTNILPKQTKINYSNTDDQKRSANNIPMTIEGVQTNFNYTGRVKSPDSTINKLNTNKNEMLSSHTDIIANRIVINTENTTEYIKQGMAIMRHLYQQHDFEKYPQIRYEIKGGALGTEVQQYMNTWSLNTNDQNKKALFEQFKKNLTYPKPGYNNKTDDGYNELKIIMNGHEYQIRNKSNDISNEAGKAHHKLYDLGKIVEERTRGIKQLTTEMTNDLLSCLTYNIEQIQEEDKKNNTNTLQPYTANSKNMKTEDLASIVLKEKLAQIGYEYNNNKHNPLRTNKKLIETKNKLLSSLTS